ncbi:UDP-N-acetylglucosamine 2-epimerase [Pseudoxanthomonas sp. UTMC 1351]|uniref:UDP-N-acetylglucosamine 2-epimerase n=1 Tax=Pseudoxanthomonas sp. UTMC 1351 TaxID=2695853 RepID=UPI0034CDE85B
MENPKLVAASAIALAVTLVAIFSMRPWARRLGLVDKPDARKRHRGRIPLIGGLCFFFGTLVGLTYLGYLDRFVMSLMAGGALLVAAGVVDDVKDTSVRSRLLIEATAAAMVIVVSGFYIDHLGDLLGIEGFRLGLIGIPVTVFAVIGLINAFNMLDGIDGLAAAMAMVSIAAVLLYDTAGMSSPGVLFLLQILFAALVPYLCVNLGWPDGRKIFMGDAGSTLIGFVLAWSLIYVSHRSVGRTAPVDVLWCVALPVMDTLAVMHRRIRLGRSPFKPDRQHLHHLLVDAGCPPRMALVAIVSAAGVLVMLGYALRGAPETVSAALFVAVLAAYMLWLPPLLAWLRKPKEWRSPSAGPSMPWSSVATDRTLALERIAAVPSGLPVLIDEVTEQDLQTAGPAVEAPSSVKTLCVLAAAPDAVKMAPIAQKLLHDERFDSTVCVTATPRHDAEQVLRLFDLQADVQLEAGSGEDPADAAFAALGGMKRVLNEVQPDLVLVPEDASTTLAAALAAYYRHIPVVSIETGHPDAAASHLNGDASRKIIHTLASLHVVHSEHAERDLLSEGVPADRMLVTGDTAVDTLHMALGRLRRDAVLNQDLARRFSFLRAGSPLLLVACRGGMAENGSVVAGALRRVAPWHPEIDIACPTELIPRSLDSAEAPLSIFNNVHSIDPQDYLAWVYLLNAAHLIVADSETQAEAAALGKPVLVVQGGSHPVDVIERANVKAVGPNPTTMADRILTLLGEQPAYEAMCLESEDWSGEDIACQRIIEALADLCPTKTASAIPTRGTGPLIAPGLEGIQGIRGAL